MKNFIISCLSLISIATYAQVTINKSDLAQPGDTLFYAGDTTDISVNMSATSGANQTWDFSSANKNTLEQAWFVDPANSPIPAPSNVTHVFIDGNIQNTTFMNATDTALYNIRPNPGFAFVGGEPFLGVRSLIFPLNYLDVSEDSIKSVSTVAGETLGLGTLADSVRITISISIKSVCDAWGLLKTPETTYDSTLRIQNTIVSTFKFEGRKSPLPFWFNIPVSSLPLPIPAKQTEITYAWLGENSKYFLAEVNMVTDSETERDVLHWQADRPVNSGLINIMKNNIEVNGYPNPASDELNLQFNLNTQARVNVAIFNIKGQQIKSLSKDCTSGANMLNVNTSDLPAGLYHVLISGNGKSASLKINIIK